MRLAVFSDIHGNLAAFEAALADFEALGGAERVWILGDMAAFGPRPVECIRRVQALVGEESPHPSTLSPSGRGEEKSDEKKPKIRAMSGNTDRYIITGTRMPATASEEQDLEVLANWRQGRDQGLNWALSQMGSEDYVYLQKLPTELHFTAEGYGPVVGYHAVPGNDETVLTADTPVEEALDLLMDREGRLGIGGHIHRQYDRDLGRWRIVNVGSVGMSADQPGMAQWGLFTFENGEASVDLRSIPYDVQAVLDDLSAVNYPAVEWVTRALRPA